VIHQKRLSLAVSTGIFIESINKIAPLIILHIAKKRLGLEMFGFALFGISFIEMVIPFVSYGYSHFGSLQIAAHINDKERISQIINNIIILRAVHSVLVFFAFWLLFLWYPPYFQYRSLYLAVSFILFTTAIETIWVHVATQTVTLVNVAIGIGRFFSLACIFLLIDNAADAILFAVLNLASNALINVLTFVSTSRRYTLARPSWAAMKHTFHRAHIFALISFLMVYFERIDVMMVEKYLGLSNAGLYAGPARIGHSLYQVANAIVIAFFSEMIVQTDQQGLTRHLQVGIWALFVFMAPISCGVWFVDRSVLQFIFGNEYAEVSSILGMIVASTFLAVLIAALGLQVLVVKHKTRALVKCLLWGTGIGTFLAWRLVQIWGIYGVSLGLIIGKLLCIALIIKESRYFIDKFPIREIIFTLLPAGIMALLLSVLKFDQWEKNIFFGALFYLIFLVAFNRSQIFKFYTLFTKKH
jgi:O-antigen/teichoic acid export membrane protein